MLRSRTIVPEPDPRERALARTMGIPTLLARVLLARGLEDPEQIRRHLRHDLSQLHDPFSFRHMKRAVDRIHHAIRAGENILVHGDYDVDGVTGTVLLLKFFELVQANVKPFIPARSDGYSLSAASIRAVREHGADLLISVDNGTNAIEAIAELQSSGCDVIVTDHHGTEENVAEAFAVLNPRLPDAGYPDRDLAGVGVAFRLAAALAESFSRPRTMSDEFRDFLVDAMAYVALGTIADVAPMRGENRVMVHHGLRALAASRNPGIRALLDAANLTHRCPDEEDVAFRVAPMINAAGRMGHALEAVELLRAPGYKEAQKAAKQLERHNEVRRRVERELTDRVLERAAVMDDPILVLGEEGWHAGVLGIVASRVAETLGRPTILVAFEEERGRGSGRSAGAVDLREALASCSSLLVSHGGHRAAVGLEIERSRLEEFRRSINERHGHRVAQAPPETADGAADLGELEVRAVRKLDLLGPFGPGNPRPRLASRRVRLVGQPFVDSRDRSVRFRVSQNGTLMPARLARGAERFEEVRSLEGFFDIVYTPRVRRQAEEGPVELFVFSLEPPGDDPTPGP